MDLLVTLKRDLDAMREAAANGDGEGMTASLLRLDERARREGDRLPPRLAHFLERRSYEKARAFIEEELENENPGSPESGRRES